MQSPQFICAAKKSLAVYNGLRASIWIKLIVFIAFAFPLMAHSQQGGCIDADTMYVNANTVPPTINATPASFTCNGSYSYQWFISTDNSHFNPIDGAAGQNFNYNQPLTSTLIFLRQAKCGSTTMYTNRVVVVPVYTACASFGLTLTGTAGNPPATIKADTIKSNTGGTIGRYVIEWYRDVIDGTPEFVSGSVGATDSAVTVLHPFAGEPAEGGTWHPVIKYVYINGIKYSRTYMPDARYSPDLLHCLDPIIVIVNNLNCANGGTVYSSYGGYPYDHKISYVNGLNSPTLATRSFRFDLDATNKYFAWYFLGYQESDKMKITYVSPANNSTSLLEWWQVGSNAGWDLSTSPKKLPFSYMYKVNSLMPFTFAAGDYLLIEITPSANSNTNWEFLCKCFSTSDCNIWDGTQRLIDTTQISMVYDAANCSYNLTYKKLAPPYTDAANSMLLKYNFSFVGSVENAGQYGWEYDDKVTLKMEKKTYAYIYSAGDSYTCNQMAGRASVSKSGSLLTVVFDSLADYNQYKNAYTALYSNPNALNYDTDSTKLNHYKFYTLWLNIAASCGDNSNGSYFYYVHYSNKPVFTDATRTLTWNFVTKNNKYPNSDTCNNTWQTIQSYIDANNSAVTGDIATVSTNIRRGDGIALYYPQLYIANDTLKTFGLYRGFPSVDPNICNLSTKGFVGSSPSFVQWQYYYYYDRVRITNTADPIHNFRLERLVDANGAYIPNPANYIKVYEIKNGVVQ